MDKRKSFYLVYIGIAIFCAFSSGWVSVNDDLTSYLPDTTKTRQGLTIMDEEFVTFGAIRVMVNNITYQRAKELAATLETLEGVKSVGFDGTEDHYRSGAALFDLIYNGTADDQINLDAEMQVVMVVAVVVALSKTIPEISGSSMTTLSGLEAMAEVDSVTALANVEAMDGYVLTDRLTPRQFAELTDLNREDIDLAAISQIVNLSPSYFSKKFKASTGFGYREYLVLVRIQTASAMLLETNKSIAEIALACGFRDSNYLGDAFKREKGVSPSAYRKNSNETSRLTMQDETPRRD